MTEGGGPRPAVLFEDFGGDLEYRAVAGRGSDVLAVVFSQVRVPSGRFGLSRLFARTRHACLFLNQPSARWYRGAETGIDDAIWRAIDAVSPARLVLYGSSMGGFGAIATAARWPDAAVVAFAPDWRIGEEGGRSAEAGLAERVGEARLADLLSAPRRGSVDVVTGLFDPYDAGVAARLDGVASLAVRVVPVRSGHEVHDHLYTVNVIRRIITGFSRDVAGSIAERGLLHPPVRPETLARFARLAADVRAGRAVDPAAVRGLDLSDNPGAMLLAADAEAASGNLDGASAVLEDLARRIAGSASLSSLPKRYRKQVPLRRFALLNSLGRAGEAARVRAEAAAAFPEDARFAVSTAGCPIRDR